MSCLSDRDGEKRSLSASVESANRLFCTTSSNHYSMPFFPSASVCMYVHVLSITVYSCVSCVGSKQSSIPQLISPVSICNPAPLRAGVRRLLSVVSQAFDRMITVSNRLGLYCDNMMISGYHFPKTGRSDGDSEKRFIENGQNNY